MSPAEIKDPSGRVVLTLPLPFNELPRDGSPVEVKIHGQDGEELPLVILITDMGHRLTVQAVECPQLEDSIVRTAFMALGEHIASNEAPLRPPLGFAEPSPFDTNTTALMAIASNVYEAPIERTVHTSPRSKGAQRRREKPWNRRRPWR